MSVFFIQNVRRAVDRKRKIIPLQASSRRLYIRPRSHACGVSAISTRTDTEPCAVAIEAAPCGSSSAKAAGIFVVAVPNNVTRDFGLDDADLVVDSLAELPPDELLARFS